MGKIVKLRGVEFEPLGDIHKTASVKEQPEITLQRWWVMAVDGQYNKGTHHFIGWNVCDCKGRVTSGVVAWDPATGRGRMTSSLVDELRGDPSQQADADSV